MAINPVEVEPTASKVETVEKNRLSVRSALVGNQTLYCVNDILSVLGIKYPGRWASKNASNRTPSHVPMRKIYYPMMTTKGYRHIRMNFVSSTAGRKIVQRIYADEGTKKWLRDVVLKHTIDGSNGSDGEEQIAVAPEVPDQLEEQDPKDPISEAPHIEEQASKDSLEERTPDDQPTLAPQEISNAEINRKIDAILMELLEIKMALYQASAT